MSNHVPHEDIFSRVAQAGANPCEKIPVLISRLASDAALLAAQEIARIIRLKVAVGEPCVLGLATGSTFIEVYRHLVRMHQAEGLSFANVTTFNLDEYYPCKPEAPQSYRRFMQEHLFDHVDIDPSRTHLPDGAISRTALPDHCAAYERRINEAGGIDLQLLGIGRTGHIGFNEPGASGVSRTRLVTLHSTTLRDNRKLVINGQLPAQAITIGVGTILGARRILLLAVGEHKANIVRLAVEGPVSTDAPASFLQNHPAVIVLLNEAAAGELTRINAPWLLGPLALQGLAWSESMVQRAVIWLSTTCSKAILTLEDEDYARNGLEELLALGCSAADLNLKVFKKLQSTITGWPAGRPEQGDAVSSKKRILVFSPHPDDDVISMGGTLARLTSHGHEVHVAYQVSGANAVSSDFLARQLDFVNEASPVVGVTGTVPGLDDLPVAERRHLAAAVRRSEARSAAALAGVPAHRCHFLDLPFYDRPDRVTNEEDVVRTREVLAKIQPHQIYAAGDLADPHDTHRICLLLLKAAIQAEYEAGADWALDCEAWLYRGAWGDWKPHEVDRAIPLDPAEVLLKRRAILRHQSQKDETPFPGSDGREFWQRAEERTAAAASMYRRLGWAEYVAMETLSRWDFR